MKPRKNHRREKQKPKKTKNQIKAKPEGRNKRQPHNKVFAKQKVGFSSVLFILPKTETQCIFRNLVFCKPELPQRSEKRQILVWFSLFFKEQLIAYWPTTPPEIISAHATTLHAGIMILVGCLCASGGLSLSDESASLHEGFTKPSRELRETFAEPPRRLHEPFAEVYEPFAEVAYTEGSTKTPWRVHEASSKGPLLLFSSH